MADNKPITIGHNYAALVHVDWEGPSTWAPPFALERTPTDWTGVDLALEQIVHLVGYDDGWHIVVADSRYGTPLFIAGLHQCPNVTGITRLSSSPRNLCHKPPPYSGCGRPRLHGEEFKLHRAETWSEPDEKTEFTEQDTKGRTVRVLIEAWHEMHFSEAPHCPFTLVKITTYRADGRLRFKHPMWLMVTHRHGLFLREIRVAYLRRPTIERFNRFAKQRLLFEAAQMGSVEQDERWAQVVKLAYWQLYISRNMWATASLDLGSGTSPNRPPTGPRRRARPSANSSDFCSTWAHQPGRPSSTESRPDGPRASPEASRALPGGVQGQETGHRYYLKPSLTRSSAISQRTAPGSLALFVQTPIHGTSLETNRHDL